MTNATAALLDVEPFAKRAQRALASGDLDNVSNEELKEVLSAAARLYAAKAENQPSILPVDPAQMTPTDVVVTVTGMLHAVNLNLWDLSMWFKRGVD